MQRTDFLYTPPPSELKCHARYRSPDSPAGFTVVRTLRQNPASAVHLARRHRENRLLVLKLLSPTADENERRAFVVGNEVAADHPHPSIVPILAAGSGGDGLQPWVAMPYYQRGSLENHVRREALLPSQDVLHIGVRVADVLHLLHVEGVLHRDVKPSNILLDDEGEPVLADVDSAAPDAPRAQLHHDRPGQLVLRRPGGAGK